MTDNLELAASNDEKRVLFFARGTALQVERIAGLGWLFELDISSRNPAVRRQLELAPGYFLERSPITIEPGFELVTLSSDQDTVTFNMSNGSFELRSEGELQWETTPEPFSFSDAPVQEHEGIISQYFATMMTKNPPSWAKLLLNDKKFPSLRVGFALKRPHGHIFGLPGSVGEFDRAGYRFELYNSDVTPHIPNGQPYYQSWPILFFQSLEGAGWCAVFWDNPSRTFVDCGCWNADAISFQSCWGNARCILLCGKTLGEVTQRLHRFLGGCALPPAWAFGYQQSRWSYMSTAEVEKVVSEFRTNQIPLDAIHLDIDYMDRFRVFTNNPDHFANLPQCISDIRESGVRAVAIVDPGVQIAEDYSVYRELMEGHKVLRAADGTPLQIRAWPGDCVLPDFSDQSTRDWWSGMQRRWMDAVGVSGVWNDMNEPANWAGGNAPLSEAHCSRGPWAPDYNLYGYYMAKASAAGCADAERPFVISRSGYPGVHQFSIIWHGDNNSWWEHLRLALDTCLSYSLAGALFTGPDIPGFMQSVPDDLAIRFFQLGAFLPFFRGHSAIFSEPKEPYRFQGDTRRLITEAIRLRYSLMRVWYSGIERCCRTFQTAMLPVFRTDGSTVRDQFLLFDNLLVAPVMQRDQGELPVYFPEGRWYPLGDTTNFVEGGKTVLVPVDLKAVPVYVRGGTILPRNQALKNVEDTLHATERLEVYPDAAGEAHGYRFDDLSPEHIVRETLTASPDGSVVSTRV